MQAPKHIPDGNVYLRHRNPGMENDLIIPVDVVCNTADDVLFEHVRTNSHNHGNWLKCCEAHDKVAILCGSGPSLLDTLPQIKMFIDAGGVVFALNNAANVLFDHGIYADYQVI